MNISPAALGALARGDLKNASVALTPGGIERQEKASQIEQSFLETLPVEMLGCTNRDFEVLGFKFIKRTDKIFWKCEFPKGWRKRAGAHSMWSDLLDDKGRVRGNIFFKAAFYDYKAHVRLTCRYSIKDVSLDADKNELFDRVTGDYKKKGGEVSSFHRHECQDNTELKTLFAAEICPIPDWSNREEAQKISDRHEAEREKCIRWMGEHFPNWKQASAYWD